MPPASPIALELTENQPLPPLPAWSGEVRQQLAHPAARDSVPGHHQRSGAADGRPKAFIAPFKALPHLANAFKIRRIEAHRVPCRSFLAVSVGPFSVSVSGWWYRQKPVPALGYRAHFSRTDRRRHPASSRLIRDRATRCGAGGVTQICHFEAISGGFPPFFIVPAGLQGGQVATSSHSPWRSSGSRPRARSRAAACRMIASRSALRRLARAHRRASAPRQKPAGSRAKDARPAGAVIPADRRQGRAGGNRPSSAGAASRRCASV